MFSLEYLKIIKHPQLGNIEVNFVESEESSLRTKPYTSIIIGPNGTGKSFILREVAEILRKIKELADNGTRLNLPYRIHIRYRVCNDSFDIVSRSLQRSAKLPNNESLRFFRNRPQFYSFTTDSFPFDENTEFDIDLKELILPERLLAVAFIHNDRFTYKSSDPTEFYQYLGLRSGRGSTSTKATQKKVIKNLFNTTIENKNFIKNLRSLLEFLEFENLFKVQYTTRYTDLFFSGNLTKANFIKFYEHWWDEDFKYSSRKEENPPWSKAYYDRVFKNNIKITESTINYLNAISNDGYTLAKKKGASTKLLILDILKHDMEESELKFIQHLESLDILELNGINIKKSNSEFSTTTISSGESTLLLSIVNIFSRITKNSLILIDEPEISLHPNWQMKYITFLKEAFSKFSNSHFLITTHSHFLVSDLEGPSSSIIALSRDKKETAIVNARLLEGKNTYGWSAEEVLLEVFQTPTTRNYFLSEKIGEILNQMADPSIDDDIIKESIKELESLNLGNLSVNDPMKEIVDSLLKKIDEE